MAQVNHYYYLIIVFLLSKKKVEICIKDHSNKLKRIKLLQDGEVFGDLNFITGKTERFTARTSSFATLLRIKR